MRISAHTVIGRRNNMAYEKVGWKDYPDKTTPINAQNLNHMDDQIAANAEKNDTQDQAIQKNENDISALNLKMGNKLGYKQIVAIKPNSSNEITFPYNSAGLIIFNGALASLFSMYQYCAFSNGLVGATITQQGTSIEYKTSANVMTIKNKSTNNALNVECLLFYGNFPSV